MVMKNELLPMVILETNLIRNKVAERVITRKRVRVPEETELARRRRSGIEG